MQLFINSRGNGACPLCEQNATCRVQKALENSLESFPPNDDTNSMELVVYSCPKFREKTRDE